MELIRYHLPTFVKHVLAPKNEFGMPKMTWRNYKSFGIRATPPPHIGKNSQKMSFFLQAPLGMVMRIFLAMRIDADIRHMSDRAL